MTAFTWQYPLFLVPMEGGYASVVERGEDEDRPLHLLAVFLQEDAAMQFMDACQVPGQPRALRNAREFCWLLQSLREPVSHVVFDPVPDLEPVTSGYRLAVRDLLRHHLVVDYSPWDYPVFVIAQGPGYASIDGRSREHTAWTALMLFTRREKAETYLRESNESGTIEALADIDQARAFLTGFAHGAAAVALDPVVDHDRRLARHCFSVQTLLEKYLVRAD